MQAKTDIVITRTQGDTDPIVFDLRVNTNGVVTKVPSTSVVTLNVKLANTVSITGSPMSNGIFFFSMNTINSTGISTAPFDVRVDEDYDYVIASGKIIFRNRVQ